MKGVILHGGAGTRLKPLTYSGPKQLIPVGNKPVSEYVLEDLVVCGVTDVAIILGETYPELVRQYYGDGSKFGVKITYLLQGKPMGIAHAVGICKDFVGKDEFVVYLGDNLLQRGISEYVSEFRKAKYEAMVLLKEVDDPTRYGVAQFDGSKRLIRLIEKPKHPPSHDAVVGVYLLRSSIFDSISSLKPSWRGELEITDAIQGLIDRGLPVGYSRVKGWWFDTGKKDDILAVNALILDEKCGYELEAETVESKVEGRVQAKKGTKIINSTVRGPVAIAEDCIIQNSFVGPHTSIGRSSSVIDSNVEHCVLMEGVRIEGVERLEDSLVGKNSKVIQSGRKGHSLQLHVGDFSEVVL